MIRQDGSAPAPSESTPPEPALSEIELVNNPALGAHLIWSMVSAAYEESQEGVPFASLFLVLPLILHSKTLSLIASTNKNSGLSMLASKLGVQREELLAIHHRAVALRDLTFTSISAAERACLIAIDYQKGSCLPATEGSGPTIPERIKDLPKSAKKIGTWFARMPFVQVVKLLSVEY